MLCTTGLCFMPWSQTIPSSEQYSHKCVSLSLRGTRQENIDGSAEIHYMSTICRSSIITTMNFINMVKSIIFEYQNLYNVYASKKFPLLEDHRLQIISKTPKWNQDKNFQGRSKVRPMVSLYKVLTFYRFSEKWMLICLWFHS